VSGKVFPIATFISLHIFVTKTNGLGALTLAHSYLRALHSQSKASSLLLLIRPNIKENVVLQAVLPVTWNKG